MAESLDLSHYALKRLLNHRMTGDVTAGYISRNVERLRAPIVAIFDLRFVPIFEGLLREALFKLYSVKVPL